MAKLKELCTINPKSPSLNDDFEVSFIPMQNVSEDGNIDYSITKKYIDVKKGFSNFCNGDIIFAKITPCMENGKGAFVKNLKNGIGFGSTEFHVLRPDTSKINGKWIYYLTSWSDFRKECEKNMTGSAGQKRVPKNFLENYSIAVPNLTQQNKIVKILDYINNIISRRKQQLSKLDQLVKSRFVEMFGDENSFYDWTTCKIDDIAKVCVGIVIKPSQYYTSDIKSGIKAFRSLNIGEMHIKNKDWVYFTKEGHQKNSKSIIKENDVLIVRSGSPGTACVATKEYAGYNAIDIIIAHPNCKKINPVFLAMFTNMPHGMNQIREKTGGAAQQHFNVGEYKNITIILPSLPLQEQFATFVQQVDKVKSSIKQSLEKLETLKKSLMQEYFG